MAAAGTNVFGKLQCFSHKLRFWGQFSGLEHEFGDYEMIVINPLCFKPLYPNNNYHLATVSWVNSMQVICVSLRKPPLRRIAHSPVYRIGKPGRCWPAFSNWLWWLSCIAPQLPPPTGAAAITHILSMKHSKSGFRMSQQEAEINRRNGRNSHPHLSLFLLLLLLSSSSFFVIHKRETVNTVILPRVAPNDETAQILSYPPSPPGAQG